MNKIEKREVVKSIVAIKAYIDILIQHDVKFDEAKKQALAKFTFVGLTQKYRREIEEIVWSLTLADMDKSSIDHVDQRVYAGMLKHMGKRDTWLRRLVWKTGLIL